MAEEKIVLHKIADHYVVAKQLTLKADDYPTRVLSPSRECTMTFKPESVYINGELLGKITGLEVEGEVK